MQKTVSSAVRTAAADQMAHHNEQKFRGNFRPEISTAIPVNFGGGNRNRASLVSSSSAVTGCHARMRARVFGGYRSL